MNSSTTLLSLDVGEKRIGVARANSIAKLPEPIETLANDGNFINQLQALIKLHHASKLVIGLPRGLDGQNTQQTNYVKSFVKELQLSLSIDICMQDEALTSVKAEEYLKSAKKPYNKADIDSVSAMFILDDYLKGIN